MKQTAVFTIVSKNYLHFARTLMSSVSQHHPEWERYVLLVDEIHGEFDPSAEHYNLLTVAEIDIPEYKKFMFRYTILELNTAVKPFMFDWLFSRLKYERVIYIDPDIYLYDTMDEVMSALEKGSLMVLTPHLLDFLEDRKRPDETDIMRSGIYNLGFLAVARHEETNRFVEWWKRKLEYDCVVDIANGLFVDQKWMDLAPGYFNDVHILRHPGYNVAYWNLNHRKIEKEGNNLFVNGERLVFFHYSGLNPVNISNVSKHQTRYIMNDLNAATQKLFNDYARNVLNAGYNQCRKWEYSFAKFNNGISIPDSVRVTYRKSKQIQEKCGSDPFDASFILQLLKSERRGKYFFNQIMKIALIMKPLIKRIIPKRQRCKIIDFLKERNLID